MSPRSFANIAVTTLATIIACGGCSDPVPLPAQGAFSLQVGAKPGPDASKCGVQAHTAHLGEPALSSSDPEVERIINNQDSAKVDCSVKSSGGGFSVSGSLRRGATFFTVSLVDPLPKDGSAPGSIVESNPTQGVTLQTRAGDECTVDALEVAPGRVWATFDCPTIYDPSSPESFICTTNGVFLFENCEQ